MRGTRPSNPATGRGRIAGHRNPLPPLAARNPVRLPHTSSTRKKPLSKGEESYAGLRAKKQ